MFLVGANNIEELKNSNLVISGKQENGLMKEELTQRNIQGDKNI